MKRLVLGGEKAAEGLRARLRELAAALGSPDVHVMATYGFTEAKMAFPECVGESHESFGYHLSPDLGLIELIDPKTGAIVPDGHPGEIVFTPLDSRGTVVLRYRTGDIAEGGLHWEKCPNCGRTCPRLVGPISRVSEVKELHMDKLKGTLVNFNVLEHLLDDQRGIAAWQLELRKRHDDPLETDEVHLHLAAEPGISESDLELAVTRRFHEATEITPNALHFHTVPEMREHLGIGRLLKEEKIADRRPKNLTQTAPSARLDHAAA
jgi:phenylacetate-coenzyme A ligase PaaK-like adenylate-forming protein